MSCDLPQSFVMMVRSLRYCFRLFSCAETEMTEKVSHASWPTEQSDDDDTDCNTRPSVVRNKFPLRHGLKEKPLWETNTFNPLWRVGAMSTAYCQSSIWKTNRLLEHCCSGAQACSRTPTAGLDLRCFRARTFCSLSPGLAFDRTSSGIKCKVPLRIFTRRETLSTAFCFW